MYIFIPNWLERDSLAKLFESLHRILLNSSNNTIIILEGVELLKFVPDVLLLCSKRPVGDRFNEEHILVEVDRLVRGVGRKTLTVRSYVK